MARLWDLLWMTPTERRWTRLNAEERLKPCRCGAQATAVRYDHRNAGRVPVEFWACWDHVDVVTWSRSGDGPWVPYWSRPQPCKGCSWLNGPPSHCSMEEYMEYRARHTMCGGHSGPIDGPPSSWHCPIRPGDGA
jgi:hypothetical protein